ncbi:nitroreductase family protein [bacterium]|nr:nitroreductase family protein [bacterium]
MTLEQAIRSRRSVRRFTAEPVSRETIVKLLELARWAPHAAEAWRFVVVQEPERKQRLAEAARQQWIASAQAILVVGADMTLPPSLSHRWDADHWWTLFPLQDTAAAIQTLMLAAVAEGLGTCWIGSFNEGDVARIVNLSFPVRPVAMVALGHPADEPPKRKRRPLDEVVFWETCQRST